MKRMILISYVAFFVLCSDIPAYEIETHGAITQSAYAMSELVSLPLLVDLGLESSWVERVSEHIIPRYRQ